MFVQNKSIIRAFEKAGFKVEVIRGKQSYQSMREHGVKDEANLKDEDRCSDSYRVTNGDLVVTWSLQNGEAMNVHCGRIGDRPDSMTDYFPGHFARTIKGAVEHLTRSRS